MATKYEYLDTGDNGIQSIYDVQWVAMTFTPSTAHIITSVKLLLYRVGSPGTLTVSIRSTDGSGHPTGGDLASGTTNGNTLTTTTTGEWREITLGSGTTLSSGTKYAIVCRALTGSAPSNLINWRYVGTGDPYTNGNLESSQDSGSTWDTYIPDLLFEDWGNPSFIPRVIFI